MDSRDAPRSVTSACNFKTVFFQGYANYVASLWVKGIPEVSRQKTWAFESERSGFKPQLCHFLVLWPLDKALSPWFPHLKMRIIIYHFRVIVRIRGNDAWVGRDAHWNRIVIAPYLQGGNHRSTRTPWEYTWGLLHLCTYYKEGKSTTKVSLPDYSGAVLGIRGDDLEKQFHCSINSQHGSRGHWERPNHSSYWTIWTKNYFQQYRRGLKDRGAPHLPCQRPLKSRGTLGSLHPWLGSKEHL